MTTQFNLAELIDDHEKELAAIWYGLPGGIRLLLAERDELDARCRIITAKAHALDAERDALKRLAEFAEHRNECITMGWHDPETDNCDCGLDAARAAVEGNQ